MGRANTDQHYALDVDQNIIHIKHAIRGNKFTCPNCGNEMIVKQGKIREWHFAHKCITTHCSFETYLHALAKIKIHNYFYKTKNLIIKFNTTCKCSRADECTFSKQTGECEEKRMQTYNLKKFYDSCDIERQYDKFQADLLLYNSKSNTPPTFIEICVTHPCSDEKLNSKIRIIELRIKSEKDIDTIIKTGFIESENIKLYNFVIKPQKAEIINHPRHLCRFILFESQKVYCDSDINCFNYTKKQKEKSLLEIIFDSFFSEYSLYELGLVIANDFGYNIKSCSLCKYHKNNDYLCTDENLPILCCLYKKLGTDKYCMATKALDCSAFRLDKKLCNDIKKYIQENDISYEIWERTQS